MDYVIHKFYELGYKVSYNKYDNVYRSCCPICREGKSWGRKYRCYYMPSDELIYCHNCGSSLSPFNWIKEVSGMSDEEIFHDVAQSDTAMDLSNLIDVKNEEKVVPTLPLDSINLFDSTQVAFYADNSIVQGALAMIERRRLRTALNAPDALYLSLKDYTHKNRLVIPFKDSQGKIVFYQSRRIFDWDDKPSYLSKTNSDKSISGMDKIDSTFDSVFLFEGPIDSYFTKNGLGLAGIDPGNHKYTQVQLEQLEELKLFRKIWVLDSQWIDDTARKKTEKLLEQGECVFIWPKKWGKYKDFNEICVEYGINGISPDFITKNAFCGKEGVLKFKVLFGKL